MTEEQLRLFLSWLLENGIELGEDNCGRFDHLSSAEIEDLIKGYLGK